MIYYLTNGLIAQMVGKDSIYLVARIEFWLLKICKLTIY